jgi:FixJ family two-component response regulator
MSRENVPIPPRFIAVAIIDDEPSVRVSLLRLCRALGLNATAYASGQAFLESLGPDAPRPDCLLLDAMMPDMPGLEVQQHLVDRGVRIPTVVFTADDAPDPETRFLAAGAAGVLRKPVGADELLAAIQGAVRPQRRDNDVPVALP